MNIYELNLHLCKKDKPVTKKDLNNLLGREVSSYPKRIRSLEMVLCHCVRFPDDQFRISLSHDKYPASRYNPNEISARPFVWIIKYLDENGYIDLDKKPNPYLKTDDDVDSVEDEDGPFFKTSTFTVNESALDLAAAVGITERNTHLKNAHHLKLKTIKNERGQQQLIDFEETPVTLQMEEDMRIYCTYLNKQDIRLDDKRFKHIHLYRNFVDYDNTGKLEYGGRTGGYWTNISKEDRPRITINGQKTVSLDYPASQFNCLYRYLIHEKYQHGDPYELIVGQQKHKIPRKIVKRLGMYALNVKETVATKRLNYYHQPINKVTRKKKHKRDWSGKKQADIYHKTMKLRGVNPAACKKAFMKKHQAIQHYFYHHTRGGQFASWLESMLVFAVARYAVEWDIPCLTIHDEFLVPEENEMAMEELMYTVGYDEGNDFVDLLDRKEYIPPPEPFDFGGSKIKEKEK